MDGIEEGADGFIADQIDPSLIEGLHQQAEGTYEPEDSSAYLLQQVGLHSYASVCVNHSYKFQCSTWM